MKHQYSKYQNQQKDKVGYKDETFSPNSKQEPVLASMTWTEKDGFKLIENQLNVNDADTVAVANFTNAINETGWSYLEVTTYPQFPDKVQVGGSVFEFL